MKTLHTFLAWISKVTNLSLSSSTPKALYAYTRFEPLPQFSNLTRLEVMMDSSEKDWSLATILASCPNLKSLDLWDYLPRLEILDILRLNVPKCLLTSLESVEIFDSVGTELIEYLLGNAAVLKEFTVTLHCRKAEGKSQFVKQILTFPRRSSACQVFVHTFCSCCENYALV
ncbi:putative F-box/FBD/LRR-repeat protein [Cardamine amara subsp. amara]|uniref:F-box/FBD/LRR-repeat protein n=1 Tax=Cardamine amara subsp. amara TaxID=228776 RepID=A0ABD1AFZ7_CARAN